MKIRFSSFVPVLAALTLFIFSPGDVGAQEKADTIKSPVSKESPSKGSSIVKTRWRRGEVVIIADLTVDPVDYKGPCPVVFNLKGNIYAKTAITTHYRFFRSDNKRSKPTPLALAKGERKEITDTWKLGDPKGPANFSEWVTLQVFYPINMKTQSNPIVLKGTCTNVTDAKEAGKTGNLKETTKNADALKAPVPQPVQNGPNPAGFPVPEPGKGPQPSTGDFPKASPPPQGEVPAGMSISQPKGTGPVPIVTSPSDGPVKVGPGTVGSPIPAP